MIEIETLPQFDSHVRECGDLRSTVVQGLDLRERGEALRRVLVEGTVFLGCELDTGTLMSVVTHGALVFPPLRDLPYQPYRNALYTPEELYRGFELSTPESYAATLDARVYAHFRDEGGPSPRSIQEALAQRLHDHAITDALEELLEGQGQPRKVVAMMGGHSMPRGSESYRAVADISRRLTRAGFLMATGGGPGAMEAAHVGAFFAGRDDAELDSAFAVLGQAPSYKDRLWLAKAFEVRSRWPLAHSDRERYPSLGVPTWHYGHEPPNAFATHVAKYFANSVREDGLLTIAKHGVIFSPGSAGTVQEVFQDACQNHYATVGVISPMVFFGEGYWKWNKPVFPLLAQLAAGHEYARLLFVTDSTDEVVQRIQAFASSAAR